MFVRCAITPALHPATFGSLLYYQMMTSETSDRLPIYIGEPKLGRAWVMLCLALAVHACDEALTGFLSVYNPTVRALRVRVPWLPVPTFGFATWFVGLFAACCVLLLLSRYIYRGDRWIRPPAYLFSVLMILNALGHIVGTIAGQSLFSIPVPRPMPGFYSSPLLLAAAIYLLYRLRYPGVR
jgi:hypothetical protein